MDKKYKDETSVLKEVETKWPVADCVDYISFYEIKDRSEEFLINSKVIPLAFGHFGFVVNSIENSIEYLKAFGDLNTDKPKMDWVEAFSLIVARILFRGVELEYLLPKGNSFFHDFLKKKGENVIKRVSSSPGLPLCQLKGPKTG